jgi:hypothetical protein
MIYGTGMHLSTTRNSNAGHIYICFLLFLPQVFLTEMFLHHTITGISTLFPKKSLFAHTPSCNHKSIMVNVCYCFQCPSWEMQSFHQSLLIFSCCSAILSKWVNRLHSLCIKKPAWSMWIWIRRSFSCGCKILNLFNISTKSSTRDLLFTLLVVEVCLYITHS